jgi:hypothetical protein
MIKAQCTDILFSLIDTNSTLFFSKIFILTLGIEEQPHKNYLICNHCHVKKIKIYSRKIEEN